MMLRVSTTVLLRRWKNALYRTSSRYSTELVSRPGDPPALTALQVRAPFSFSLFTSELVSPDFACLSYRAGLRQHTYRRFGCLVHPSLWVPSVRWRSSHQLSRRGWSSSYRILMVTKWIVRHVRSWQVTLLTFTHTHTHIYVSLTRFFSIRRGFQVYREVCAACHSLDRISGRNLVGSLTLLTKHELWPRKSSIRMVSMTLAKCSPAQENFPTIFLRLIPTRRLPGHPTPAPCHRIQA